MPQPHQCRPDPSAVGLLGTGRRHEGERGGLLRVSRVLLPCRPQQAPRHPPPVAATPPTPQGLALRSGWVRGRGGPCCTRPPPLSAPRRPPTPRRSAEPLTHPALRASKSVWVVFLTRPRGPPAGWLFGCVGWQGCPRAIWPSQAAAKSEPKPRPTGYANSSAQHSVGNPRYYRLFYVSHKVM